jgi:hypothetical protein
MHVSSRTQYTGLSCVRCALYTLCAESSLVEHMKLLGLWLRSWLPDCGLTELPAALHGCGCMAGALLPAVASSAFGGNSSNSVIYNTIRGGGALLLVLIPYSMHYVTRGDMRMGAPIGMSPTECLLHWMTRMNVFDSGRERGAVTVTIAQRGHTQLAQGRAVRAPAWVADV